MVYCLGYHSTIRVRDPDPESSPPDLDPALGDVYLTSNCFQKDVLNQFFEKLS
jgi:hypothetical protein